MEAILVLFFVSFGLFCNAQNELYVINRRNEKNQKRIYKASYLRVKTVFGKTYSGTLIKVNDFDIVLMASEATINIEDIVSIKIVHKGTGSVMITPFFVSVTGNKFRKFYMKNWRLMVKA